MKSPSNLDDQNEMSLKKPQDLEEGMILASEVANLDGQTLFAKGVSLSQRQIEILQMWGIPNVEIEGDEEDLDQFKLDQFSPSVIAKAEGAINLKFKLVKSSHPAVEIIRKICVLKSAKTFQREGKNK